MKFQGYEHDDILTRTLTTDTNGEAALAFKPERDGLLPGVVDERAGISNVKSPLSIRSRRKQRSWVVDNATTQLGYRQGAVEIIADKDTFRVGQKAPVMLVAPANDRYVLVLRGGR